MNKDNHKSRKALVMGWFSFEMYGATAGDLMAKDLVCDWLKSAEREYDVALAPPFQGGVDWRVVPADDYSVLVFVCGPFGESNVTRELLDKFAHCKRIGVNLTMLQSIVTWNPFDLLIERDSPTQAFPDITFLCDNPKVPVVGLILVHPQKEYGKRGRHLEANQLLRDLTTTQRMAVVKIDTRLDENSTNLRCPQEVEALIARMDVVLTTRLHGTALAIKNGVPPISLDPIGGGAKVFQQASILDWPARFITGQVTPADLQSAFAFCLTAEARAKARACATRAKSLLMDRRDLFLRELNASLLTV